MNANADAVRIRLASADECQSVYENQARTFGVSAEPADTKAWERRVELDNILIAEDVADPEQPLLVGTSLCYRSQLTVPGGATLSAAWLAMITVAATHQGRGIWQRLGVEGFRILQERGYPILCGVPTDPKAYELLGAGVASYALTYDIEPRYATLRTPPDQNRAKQVNAALAEDRIPEIYDRWRAVTPGALSRDDAWWADFFEDRVTQRDGGSALNFVIHPDGFMTYRVIGATAHAFRPPFGGVVVQDFCAITDEAHTDLMAAFVGLDLFDNIRIELPLDDPLPLKLRDQRIARVAGSTDFLWIRVMDVPEVVGTRTYSADIDAVLEVADPLGVAGGRFHLQVHDGTAKCVPCDNPPDIKIGLGELGAIYMGAHRVADLSHAGRITELRDGALRDLDAAFRTERAPYCGTMF